MPRGISILRDELERDGVRLVFSLALFVLHYATLQIEGFLIELAEQEAHAVGVHPERVIERGSRHVYEVVGAVIVGGAAGVGGADFCHGVRLGALGMFVAAGHQMPREASATALAGPS